MVKFVVAVNADGTTLAMTADEFSSAQGKGWVPLFTNHWENDPVAEEKKD